MGGSLCDRICKKVLYYLQIMCKRYQHPHLPGKSSAFTRRSEQKHLCRHSVFTYYTICFYGADIIIVLHCAFKSSCQQGNHLSFKILHQISTWTFANPQFLFVELLTSTSAKSKLIFEIESHFCRGAMNTRGSCASCCRRGLLAYVYSGVSNKECLP